jgi:chorismate mutase/prephenate dehydrogenase
LLLPNLGLADPIDREEESTMKLEHLRVQLADLDRKLLSIVARRQELAAEIGHVKREAAMPVRDYAQEREVIRRTCAHATKLGLPTHLAEKLLLLLVESSLTVQEQDQVMAHGVGGGRRVLVIGGRGKMGQWFVRFLVSQGYEVEVADPAGPVEGHAHLADWSDSALDHDVIIVAAPLRQSKAILEGLASKKPGGLVFDIGSLKTPLRSGLEALASAGVQVTSLHPMFGPNTELLSGRHVIFVDVGVPEALPRARELFASTMAVQVDMDLESHDRLIAYVLGLSHALNIAFFTALADSGEAAPKLEQLSSVTFDHQLQVARSVAEENPHLYFEIQALNDYGTEAITSLLHAVERLRSIVRAEDENAFVALMQRGRDYLRELRRTADGAR